MAKNSSGGPGVHERGGVRSTMENCNNAKTSTESNSMKAPFDKPHSMGGDGIPLKMYDTDLKPGKMPTPGQGQGNSPIPRSGGQQRPGTK